MITETGGDFTPAAGLLSLCMIVRDEAELLPQCLQSVSDLVDEIVVVDTGSTDATVEIAAAAGARIYHLPWPGDFSLARNAALEKARCDWILMLDADEYLDADARRVLAAFRTDPPPPARFRLRICNAGASGQLASVYFMEKLFPNRPTIRYVAPSHEFVYDIADPPTPLLPLPGLDIQHLGHLPGRVVSREKHLRDRELIERALERFPDAGHSLYHLASICKLMGETELALQHYQRLLATFPVPPGLEHPSFSLAIIDSMECFDALAQPGKALALAERAEAGCAHHPDYWMLRGRLLRRLGRPDEARACFRRCLDLDESLLMLPHRPQALNTLPLLQLLQLDRALAHHPARSPAERAAALTELQEVLLRLLQLHPSGRIDGPAHNLHLLLAELLLTHADPPQAYLSLLPPQATGLPEAAQTADLLACLSGQPVSVLPAAPDPDRIPALATRLWHSGEHFLALGLLHLAMHRHARPDYALHLAELLRTAGDEPRARQLLLEASLSFPAELSGEVLEV
ncbi:MAG: glycosyltransferase [Candidatus Sericytochromatia bacterium]